MIQVLKLFPKRFLIFLGLVILLFLVLVITSLTRTRSLNEIVNLNPENKLVALEPPALTPISTDTTPIFKFQFLYPLNMNDLNINFTKHDFSQPESPVEKVLFTSNLAPNRREISIYMTEPVEGYKEYKIAFTKKKDNLNMALATYISEQPLPTPIPSNNLDLKQHLPYETDTYLLEYSPLRNLYVFHFFVDPNSNDTLEAQFNAAKEDALEFITSKDIDPSSVIIDWSYN